MKRIVFLLSSLAIYCTINDQDSIVIRPDKDALMSSYYSQANNNYGSYPYFTSQVGTNHSNFSIEVGNSLTSTSKTIDIGDPETFSGSGLIGSAVGEKNLTSSITGGPSKSVVITISSGGL